MTKITNLGRYIQGTTVEETDWMEVFKCTKLGLQTFPYIFLQYSYFLKFLIRGLLGLSKLAPLGISNIWLVIP